MSLSLLLHQFSAHHKDEDKSSPRTYEFIAAPVWGTQEVELGKEAVCIGREWLAEENWGKMLQEQTENNRTCSS